MASLRMNRCMCWTLRIATIIVGIIVIVGCVGVFIIHLLDVLTQYVDGFEIRDGFYSLWRRHVHEGWTACNIVMMVASAIMIGASIILFQAVIRFPIITEKWYTVLYIVLLICYIIIDLGVACYQFSWYGPNTFRRAYLAFTCLFFIIRFILYVFFVILLIFSRLYELNHVIKYGETDQLMVDFNLSTDILTSREFLNRRAMLASQSSAYSGYSQRAI